MSETKVHIRLTCIYARKDAFIQQQLSSHLESLHLERYLDAVQFMEVSEEAFAERRYTQEQREADIFLILVSPHLMATPFIHAAFLRNIVTAHQYEQIKMVPLVVADGNYNKTSLGKLERLNANQVPIKSEHEFSLEAILTIIKEELKLVVIDWADKKQEFESRWKETTQEDKLQYYSNFLKDYPHNIYRDIAKKRLNELKELDLWRTAKAIDKVHQYYLYLRDAPLQEKRVDAIQRIAEIEQDEGVARDDALQSVSLPVLFNYKVRFPRGPAMAEIDDKINSLEKERINHLDEPEYIQTEAHYLQHLAYGKLNQDELLSMRLLLDFNTSLIRRSQAVTGQISNSRISLVMLIVFGFFVGVYFVPDLIRYAIEGTLDVGFKPFTSFIICLAGLFLTIQAYRGIRYAAEDLDFCRLIRENLERSLVTIKISSIDHDHQAIFQETALLLRIEVAYKKLAEKSFLTYLFDHSAKGTVQYEDIIKKLPLPLRG